MIYEIVKLLEFSLVEKITREIVVKKRLWPAGRQVRILILLQVV